MTMDNSKLDEKYLQPLKKRKIQVNDILDNTLVDNKLFETVDEITKQENKENNEILTENVNIKSTPSKKVITGKESLVNNNNSDVETSDVTLNLIKTEEHIEDIRDYNNDNELMNENKNSTISIRKLEDLCETPKKNVALENLVSTENIKIENVGSPQVHSPSSLSTNSMDWFSRNIKIIPETPVRCKIETSYPSDDNTPSRDKDKKLNNEIGDCDQLSDVIKSELCNTCFDDMEPIDMLHDLNSVMNFEESKLVTNFFCSTVNNTMQEEQNTEISTDPEIDPLFIAEIDETTITLKNTEDKKMKEKNNRLNSKKRQKKCSYNETNAKKHKPNNEDININYDIKDILGELDIDANLEEENKEEEEEEEEEEKEKIVEFSKDAIVKLYNLKVELIHNVPQQHKIEHTAGSRTLTARQRRIFLGYGPLKSGTFTPNEDKVILDNWKRFCEVHNWNPKHVQPFLYMKNGNKFYIRSMEERQKFVQFLANGLPWRTLFSVYHRFRALHENHKNNSRRYTSVEDEKILSHVKGRKSKKKMNKKFVELSKVLGRSSHSVWLRYQLLKAKKENKQLSSDVKWTLPLIGKFIKTFMDITLSENVEELKDAVIPKSVWKKLEEKLDIHYNILKTFWILQLHMQFFCPEPIYLNDIKIKLIEYIYGKGISNTREIVWSNVAKYFDGLTSIFLCKVFSYLAQEATAKIGTKYFPDIIEYLYNKKIRDIRNELTDKFLPRLSYENEEVKIIDEDLNEHINDNK